MTVSVRDHQHDAALLLQGEHQQLMIQTGTIVLDFRGSLDGDWVRDQLVLDPVLELPPVGFLRQQVHAVASAAPAVRTNGGAVLVHRANTATAEPLSTLIQTPLGGAIVPCGKLVFEGDGGVTFHVTVESFDLADGSATVSMGFGRTGKFVVCKKDVVTSPGGVEFPRRVP